MTIEQYINEQGMTQQQTADDILWASDRTHQKAKLSQASGGMSILDTAKIDWAWW